MNYESQGIQPEGRLVEIGQEAGGLQGEHGQSQGRKVGKNTSWKYKSTCQNCGTVFAGRKGAANRFCKPECQSQFSVNRWLSCSKCLASIGYGAKTAGRLLGISPSQITRRWMILGIKAQLPQDGYYKTIASKIARKKYEESDEYKTRQAYIRYERAWLDECKPVVGPDWSKHPELLRLQYNNSARKQWEKRKQDPQFRIKKSLRRRYWHIISRGGGTKDQSVLSLLGCSPDSLRKHLESQFDNRMSWNNYGTYWHIDHIIPCTAFDQTDKRQRESCWHWTNLRPLEAKSNISKGATITEPQLHLLLSHA